MLPPPPGLTTSHLGNPLVPMALKSEASAERTPGTVHPDEAASRGRSRLDLTPEQLSPGWRGYVRAMGPGLITGASDDDPSGIGTYSQAGSQFGYALLWTALVTFPL